MSVHHRELERVMKALASKRRLAILAHLKAHKEVTVGTIAEAINLSFKSTSRHLAVLSGADILEKEQRSLEVYYSLNSKMHPTAKHLLAQL